MERTLKIFISCTLGAGIGAMLALEISGYFWWLGLLAGGLSGYLSYEFKAVIAAAQQAWYEVAGWRPSKTSREIFGLGILATMAFVFTLVSPVSGYLLFSGRSEVLEPIIFGGLSGLMLGLSGVSYVFLEIAEGFDSDETARKWLETYKILLKFGNPIVFWLYVAPKYSKKGIVKGIPLIFRFVKRIFILIHSEIRLLCGVDAAIGSAIGYFAGSVLVGAIAGGIIGVLNYKIISVRVLRLAPSKSM